MAMENSLCDEYATEKLYLALVYRMVPVVWGGEYRVSFGGTGAAFGWEKAAGKSK